MVELIKVTVGNADREGGGVRQKKGQSIQLNVSNYLVDPASSHMLVSKIKPCMCKYKPN